MSRFLTQLVLVSWLGTPALGAVIGDPKTPYNDQPEDKRRTHVELITTNRHTYPIDFRGTIDGTMTRMPVGYAAFHQGWQPNRIVRIENVGQTDVRNPRLIVNGKRDWRTLDAVVAEATRGYSTPADQARAIWEFIRHHRFHACTWDSECNDALKVLNVYGYTLCGNQAQVLDSLWKAAGLKTRRCFPIGHVVGEVYYNSAYHMLDSDEHVTCLKRDNKTIASATDIVRDHDLVKRTHTYGIGHREDRKSDEFSASLYVWEGARGEAFRTATPHSMDLTLRPGESITFRWDHIGKQYSAGRPVDSGTKKRDGDGDLLSGWGATAYDNLRNGQLCYQPDLTHPNCRRGAGPVVNAEFDSEHGQITSVDPNQPASIVWHFASPYIFVGGQATATVRLAQDSSADWSWSPDRATWTTLTCAGEPGERDLTATLDDWLSPRGRPMYGFWLQLTLHGEAAVNAVTFENDIQTSALSLPELEVGANQVAYTDTTPEAHQVRVTHEWLERASWHPPDAPATAVFPADNATVDGTRFTFRWSPATDPDRDAIADYHFQLSEHSDMRWPLSPTFDKLTSHTSARGGTEWAIPYTGLLNAGTTYYWHVRAMDTSGVWGSWSRTFRFQTIAPGVPQDAQLHPDKDGGLTLTWHANGNGTRPVAYKVYGSDEKGFSVSDSEYTVFRGKGFVNSMEDYVRKDANASDAGLVKSAGNLITRLTDASLRVVGADLTLPNTNKAYYRVVAIDSAGRESGASDYAAVPRPFVYTQSAVVAKLGQPFEYRPQLIRSIGDLRCRRSEQSSYNAAYWDRDQFTFQTLQLPPGLSLDPSTGRVSGVPSVLGTFELRYQVVDPSKRSVTYAQTVTVSD